MNSDITRYDLHTHSVASDGTLTPTGLVNRAQEKGVQVLALTDHDTVKGLDEAVSAAQGTDLRLIPGIELSVSWQNKLLHIVGLNIDRTFPPLLDGIARIKTLREVRAEKMGASLARKGITGAYEGAKRLAGEGMLTRTHFARFLVDEGHAPDVGSVFKKFLVHNKPGYVSTTWSELDDAVSWITDGGGIAVLAHPLRYRMTGAWLRRTLEAFRAAGGQGIEIIYGNNSEADNRKTAKLARQFELRGSVGSDFHSPDNPWIELGRLPQLPNDITPVWHNWA